MGKGVFSSLSLSPSCWLEFRYDGGALEAVFDHEMILGKESMHSRATR